jgi:concentrative nucleoside transporter, CNT family
MSTEKNVLRRQRGIRAAAFLMLLFCLGVLVVADEALPGVARSTIGLTGILAVFVLLSAAPDRLPWRCISMGLLLQAFLAWIVVGLRVGDRRPGMEFFQAIGHGIEGLLGFSAEGGRMVFGILADPEKLQASVGKGNGMIFAFTALPTLVFISSLSAVLYQVGVLQLVVGVLGTVIRRLLGTSGPETFGCCATVFIGQTEAPLVVKPFLAIMTRSELLALMAGGMAAMSGAMMAVYIGMGADPVGVLAASVMAAPCSLYLSKMLFPEEANPSRAAPSEWKVEKMHHGILDALTAGASEGMMLALHVAAMLIAFLALIALLRYLLQACLPGASLDDGLAWLFRPVALLAGFSGDDALLAGRLLGKKFLTNEFIAYGDLTGDPMFQGSGDRFKSLAACAISGFANLGSMGIQIGCIGALVPERRALIASIAPRALLAGFAATLISTNLMALFRA